MRQYTHGKTVLSVVILAVLAVAGAFGAGGREVVLPSVELTLDETVYFSPGASPGVQDSIEFGVGIAAGERLVVKGLRLNVYDANGSLVYTKEERYPEEQPFFEQALIAVGFYGMKKPFTVPETLEWDGSNMDGGLVPEGRYTLQVDGWDDTGRTGESSVHTVIVDNTAPTAELSAPYVIFSPNNDGNKDILFIEQYGTEEPVWDGKIENADGATVAEFSWKGSEPQNFSWDGMASEEEAVPDGPYTYTLAGTDRAGNTFTTFLDTIRVDTKDTPISLGRDLGHFSPNNDGASDELVFQIGIPVQEGIREWELVVTTMSGSPVRSFTGNSFVPSTVSFNGRDSRGTVIRDGRYTARLSVLYENGNNPSVDAPPFEVDLTPPTVSVKVHPPIISPNGDGNQDVLTVYQDTSNEDTWTGVVKDQSGREINRMTWRGRANAQMTWDAKDQYGSTVPNGRYTYALSARDKAGNYAEDVSTPFEVDVRSTPVSLTITNTHFSPNQDGKQDTVDLQPIIADPEGVKELNVTVVDENDMTIRGFTATQATSTFTWDGRTDGGRRSPDGEYNARLEVTYDNGNRPSATAGPVYIDTEFPSVELSVDNLFFSPDDDGNQDTITIKQRSSSDEELWVGAIVGPRMAELRTKQWRGRARDFAWDGRDDDGNLLPDGEYMYAVFSTDRAGNRTEVSVSGITIDTRETPVRIRLGGTAFSPDGNGVQDYMQLTPVLEVRDNIDNWQLEVKDSGGTTKRRYSGTGAPPTLVRFDGNDDSLAKLPEGDYIAHLTVEYKNGKRPSARSGEFTLDLTAPQAETSVNIPLFSPNGDGNKDLVVIRQTSSEERVWHGTIQNAEEEIVRSYVWYGSPPASIEWNGRDNRGRMVPDGTYSYRLRATDRAGNDGRSNSVVFTKDTRRTPLSLTAASSHFSPNGDGVKDTMAVRVDVGMLERIERYQFEIIDSRNNSVYTRSGRDTVPRDFVWDGTRGSGQTVPEGNYRARIQIDYAHGNQPIATSSFFALDVTRPQVTATADDRLFSPDGDGRKDNVTVEQSSSREDLWEGQIVSASGRTVRSFFWKGAVEDLVWDGTDTNGNTVPDGQYRYVVTSTDSAGNTAEASVPGIQVDTRTASAYVNPSPPAISPNGDGERDTVRLSLYKSLSEGITDWSLTIVTERGTVVRDLTGSNSSVVPSFVTWDGKNSSGRVIDGEYFAELSIEYQKGNRAEARSSSPIVVDATAPSYTVSMSPTVFSPDDDGVADTVRISFNNIREAGTVAEWSIRILDPYDHLFYSVSGEREPVGPFVWDGLSEEGELVQAAEDYKVVTTMEDALGNVREQTDILPIDILVFREGDNLKIRISSIQFPPNSADFKQLEPEQVERNMKTLRRLAEILKKYSTYQIRIEGHAVSVYWYDEDRAKTEETEELQPLSRNRAEAVKDTLISLGISARRMTTEGMGGTQPVVPHSDLENRWKSRRVEFILIK